MTFADKYSYIKYEFAVLRPIFRSLSAWANKKSNLTASIQNSWKWTQIDTLSLARNAVPSLEPEMDAELFFIRMWSPQKMWCVHFSGPALSYIIYETQRSKCMARARAPRNACIDRVGAHQRCKKSNSGWIPSLGPVMISLNKFDNSEERKQPLGISLLSLSCFAPLHSSSLKKIRTRMNEKKNIK